MSTLQELKLKAEKKITSIPFNTDPKGIVKFASEQIQQADSFYKNNDFHDAYLRYYIAITLILSTVPKHQKFNASEQSYQKVRANIDQVMTKLEIVKDKLNNLESEESLQDKFQRLQPQKPTIRPQYLSLKEPSAINLTSSTANRAQVFDSKSNAPTLTKSNSFKDSQTLKIELTHIQIISVLEIFEILKLNKSKILFIDFRPLEIYLEEHIGYPSNTNVSGGIINLEHEYITSDITLEEIEKLCDMGCINDKQRNLLLKRLEMDYIVFYDQKSRSANDCFQAVANVLDSKKIYILSGGYNAWNYFLKSSSHPQSLWIESGEALDKFKSVEFESGKPLDKYKSVESGKALDTFKGSSPADLVPVPPATNHPMIPTRQRSLRDPKESERISQSFEDPFFTFRSESLLDPLISLPDSNNAYEEALNRFPEVTFEEPLKVSYPSIVNSRSNSPNPYQNDINNSRYQNSMPAPISYQSLNQVGYLGVNSPQQQFQKAPAGSYNQGQQYGSYNGQYQSINPQNGNNYQTINSQQYQNNYSQVNNQQFNSSQYQNNSPVIRNNYSQGISTPPLSYNGLGYGTSHLPSSPQTNNVYPTQYTSPVNQPPQIPIKSPYRQEVNPQAIPPPTSSKYSTLASIPFQSPQIPQKALLNSPPPVAPRPASLRPSVESRPLTGPALPRKPNIDLSMITRTNTMEYPSSPIHAQFGISGLRNLGNTCFMNSTLQCLSATIPFARYFLGGSYKRHIARNNPLGSKGKVAEAFASLIQSVWSGEESVVNPSSFKQCIGLIHPSFAGNEQQDSHEFLSFILDQLHEDLNIARRPFPENGPDLDSELYQEKEFMQIETRKYHLRNWSIVVDMFQGILKSVLQCLKCGKTSTTYNQFQYLTLPIPTKACTIQQCIETFLETETLTGEDGWNCPRCKKKRDSTKRLSIVKLPIVLLIHLKRFSFDGPFRNKLETFVDYPLTNLNLTPYTYFMDRPSPQNHFGNLTGGHYTAMVKHHHQNSWYNLDDSRASECRESDIKSSAGYILFYVKNLDSDMHDWWKGTPEL